MSPFSMEEKLANYLKGIGDVATRTNEILPSLDARINYFLCGHTSGVIKNEFYEFSASKIDRGVVVKSGLCQAHGYFGCTDSDTQINFIMPSTTQYVQLYAEIDLSVIPNKFEIKATAMSNSTSWTPRQDNLRATTNGKFQLHLWQVTLTVSAITLTDKRAFIAKPSEAVTAENYASGGEIEKQLNLKAPLDSPSLTGTPTAPTAAQTVNNTQLATTSYVRQAISDVKNIVSGTASVGVSGSTVTSTIKRQVNFVVIKQLKTTEFYSAGSAGTRDIHIGTLPQAFRPKSNITCPALVTGINEMGNWSGYHTCTIKTDGQILVTIYISFGTAAQTAEIVNIGYEIT